MRTWLKDTQTNEIIFGLKTPTGWNYRAEMRNFLQRKNLDENELGKRYKILYKNPFIYR